MAAQSPMDALSAGGWAERGSVYPCYSALRILLFHLFSFPPKEKEGRSEENVHRMFPVESVNISAWNDYSFTIGVSGFWLGASSDCRIFRIAMGVLLREIEGPMAFTGHAEGSASTMGCFASGESFV